jgi:tripartite-type tricarboxylate transporter receptor subunit TctC
MISRRAVLKGTALSIPTLSAARGQVPDFPTRPVRLVVPFAPGGAVDLTGRFLGERLQSSLGQNVLVENRGGAGGNLGADVVAKAEKDGHTLLLGSASLLCANKFLYRRSMPLDPVRDLAPVTRVATGTVLLIVNSGRPWRSFDELVAAPAPSAISQSNHSSGPPASTSPMCLIVEVVLRSRISTRATST